MKTLQKHYQINATPDKVFNALTNTQQIKAWSGQDAKINPIEGGEFSIFGGNILGVNRKVGQKEIVQDWKEKTWKEFSRVTFKINQGEGLTEVELTHEQIPDDEYENINTGWDNYYMGPLKEYLEGKG